MECLQVAVADCDSKIRQSLRAAMQEDTRLNFVGGACDGAQAYRLIRDKQPDVAIVDMVLPKADGFSLIERVKQDNMIRKELKFILTTPAQNEQIMSAAFQMGVSYFVLKPYDPLMLTKRVKQLAGIENSCMFGKGLSCPGQKKTQEGEIRAMLYQLGIPAHLRGCRYMVSAIQAVMNDEQMLECVTKELYPLVAKEYGSTASRVERALRHAIEAAWSRNDMQQRDQLFGKPSGMRKGKPTNSEFIAVVSNYMKDRA